MSAPAAHVPVLLDAVCEAIAPIDGKIVVDCTFGAGGYSRAFARGGAVVIGLDRDPEAIASGPERLGRDAERVSLVESDFAQMEDAVASVTDGTVDAVVMDLGVSSMQIDQSERGFSFMRDGPLDMRMGSDGPSAADLVNSAPEGHLADIIRTYGEDRAARRIARAIVARRVEAPIVTTLQLAEAVASAVAAPRPGQIHPATRTFQGLRIAVNDELGQLANGLHAAERLLGPGGRLVAVTFHSLEDRIVKRFLQVASGSAGRGSRHMPERPDERPRFHRPDKAVVPGQTEVDANPRARSARLRAATRTDVPPRTLDPRQIGVPQLRTDFRLVAEEWT